MKNLKKTAKRIKDAVRNKENIVLYADSDLDGVISLIILEETIEKEGGSSSQYISDREKWGYGISREAVLFMQKEAPAVLISMDCGISNFEGADVAKKLGFEFIIIDHHKPLAELPTASIILDPMQKGDKSTFKRLANAGIVYKLAEEILGEKFEDKKRRFLELASIATIADMVPKEEDNKRILDEGLPYLKNPSTPSLRELKKESKEKFMEDVVSLLNITKPKKNVNDAYLFLLEEEREKILKKIDQLKEKRKKRKEKLAKEEEKIVKRIKEDDIIVFEKGDFPSHFAGSLASKIIRKTKKPVFLYVIEKDMASGSVRMVPEYDAVEAMKHCSNFLYSFGGHKEAAGFMVEKKNIENFRKKLIKYFIRESNNLKK